MGESLVGSPRDGRFVSPAFKAAEIEWNGSSGRSRPRARYLRHFDLERRRAQRSGRGKMTHENETADRESRNEPSFKGSSDTALCMRCFGL